MQEGCLHQQKTTTMKKSISVIVLFVIILSGCTHYYYAPNVQNVPLFTGKNEFRLSGQFGYTVWDLIELGDQQTTCIDLQSAYSLTNNITHDSGTFTIPAFNPANLVNPVQAFRSHGRTK